MCSKEFRLSDLSLPEIFLEGAEQKGGYQTPQSKKSEQQIAAAGTPGSRIEIELSSEVPNPTEF